jgi:hypothetical protein
MSRYIRISKEYYGSEGVLILVRNGSYTILIQVDVTARIICMKKWNESFM